MTVLGEICGLGQQLLLSVDMREWLTGGHLVWFINDMVDEMDLLACSCSV